MHARIATARTRPSAAADVERVWRSLLEPYRQSGSFRGIVALYDHTDNTAVTITLWSSQSEADEAAAALRPLASAAFADLLLEPPTITMYDCLLTELGPARPGSDA